MHLNWPHTVLHLNRTHVTEKSTCASKCFFQLNPPLAEEIHLRWMKSLRDEICLTAGDGGGYSLSEAARLRFHLRRHAEDFIRAPLGFHRATHDFILFGSVAGFELTKASRRKPLRFVCKTVEMFTKLWYNEGAIKNTFKGG